MTIGDTVRRLLSLGAAVGTSMFCVTAACQPQKPPGGLGFLGVNFSQGIGAASVFKGATPPLFSTGLYLTYAHAQATLFRYIPDRYSSHELGLFTALHTLTGDQTSPDTHILT